MWILTTGQGGQFQFSGSPAFMAQNTFERRLTGHIAGQFYGVGIKTRFNPDLFSFAMVYNRLKGQAFIDHLFTVLVYGTNRTADLNIFIKIEIFREKSLPNVLPAETLTAGVKTSVVDFAAALPVQRRMLLMHEHVFYAQVLPDFLKERETI